MHKRAARIADVLNRNKSFRGFEGEERTREESLSASRVLWLTKGTHRGFVNVGTQRYRQIAVELK